MAFYGERFRRPDEEDIWEELKYWLQNPITKEEQTLRKQQEQAYVNEIVNKMFPDEILPMKQKEPYLRYEDLLDKPEIELPHNKVMSLKENSISKDYPHNLYEEIDAKEDWSEELKSQKKAEVAEIQERARAREREINREHVIEQAKNYGGAALEIGSAAIPGALGGKIATKVVGQLGKKLAPKIGRKIAKEIGDNIATGAVSGGVEGLGRGLLEDENPLKTAVQDAATGAVLGTGAGAIGGKVEKVVRGNRFRKIDSLENLNNKEIKNLRKDATKYYDDYIKGTTVKRNDMDEINFGNAGINELKSRSLHNVKILPDLKKQIKTGKKLTSRYDYSRDDIKGFEVIQNSKDGKTYEYLIAKDKANGNKFYMPKDVTKKDSSLTDWNQHPGSEKNLNNIISPSQSNLNPNTPQTLQKPSSFNDWLEELKRKRKKRDLF